MKQEVLSLRYKGCNRGCLIHLPAGFEENKEYYAILDLHGLGQRSRVSDSATEEQVKAEVLYRMVSGLGTGFPTLIKAGFEIDYIVISPQMWGSGWWDNGWVKAVYDYLISNYKIKKVTVRGVEKNGVLLHGISAGGKGVGNFAASYPHLVVATIDQAGARSDMDVSLRKDVPNWSMFGDSDWTVNASNGANYTKELNASGGTGFYTYLEKRGHDGGNWDKNINGTQDAKQKDYAGLSGRKELRTGFPFGEWFESLVVPVAAEPPVSAEPARPVEQKEPKVLAPVEVTGSDYNPDIMFSEGVAGAYFVGWNPKPWHVIARLNEESLIKELRWYDSYGVGEFFISFSQDGKVWNNFYVFDLDQWQVWRSLVVDEKARFVKIYGNTPVVPARVQLIGFDGDLPRLYDLSVSGATEEEKAAILAVCPEKIQIK